MARAIEKLIDKGVFGPIAYLPRLFNYRTPKAENLKNVKKILIIKLWAIGDSVNSLPLIKSIKEKYPNSKITVLCNNSNSQVYKNQDFIDEITLFGPNIFKDFKYFIRLFLDFRKYDLAFDLEPYLNLSAVISAYTSKVRIGFDHGIRRNSYHYTVTFQKDKHIVNSYMNMIRVLGFKISDPKELISLNYPYESKKKVDDLLSKVGLDKKFFVNKNSRTIPKIIGLCPSVGESVKEREWGIDNYTLLIDKLLSKYKNSIIILVGSSKDSLIYTSLLRDRVYDLSGKTDLLELFYLIEKYDLFISNDTGPMHIAAAQKVKTIGLFGPNTPRIWAPYGKSNISIFHPLIGCPYLDNTSHDLMPKILSIDQKNCMSKISVNEVYLASIKLLSK